MGVDEAAVKAAIKARKNYILSNLDTMSLKSCRQKLEDDMGLESGALKPFKQLLSDNIDKLIAKHRPAGAATPGQAAAAEEPEGEQSIEDEEPASSGKKQLRKQKSTKPSSEKPSKRQKHEDKPPKQSGPRQYSRKVEKLRSICKAATITIPPSLYVKNKGEDELAAALEALLEKHDLDINSGEREIGRAKVRLQTQRDLDGIDSSNIITGGRQRRGGAAPVFYKAMIDLPSESEEEDEEESASEDDEQQSGSDAEAGSEDERPAKPAAKPAAAKKQKAKPAKPAESESEAASSEEEEEEVAAAAGEDSDASAGVADFKSPAGARSPDENLASRGNGGSSGKGKAAAVRAKSSNKAARPAASLEDSDGEQPAVPAKRRAMADWSDDE